MGNYQQHLIFGYLIGLLAGVVGYYFVHLDLVYCILACMLGTFAAILPDLDHDQSVPLREVFNVTAAIAPFIVISVLMQRGMEDMVWLTVIFGGSYLLIRTVIIFIFKQLTTHRGMFHSIPALLIVGEIVYLLYIGNEFRIRMFLTAAAMAGFLSHLVLDELSSVDFTNGRVTKNKFFGSALDFYSKSHFGTGFAYLLLLGLFAVIVLKKVDLL